MFVIAGINKEVHSDIWCGISACPHCGEATDHHLKKLKVVGTMFYIPFMYRTIEHLCVCDKCGGATEMDRTEYQELKKKYTSKLLGFEFPKRIVAKDCNKTALKIDLKRVLLALTIISTIMTLGLSVFLLIPALVSYTRAKKKYNVYQKLAMIQMNEADYVSSARSADMETLSGLTATSKTGASEPRTKKIPAWVMGTVIFIAATIVSVLVRGAIKPNYKTNPPAMPFNATVDYGAINKYLEKYQSDSDSIDEYPEDIQSDITIQGEKYSLSLQELDLYGLDLTDEDIAPLKDMTELRELYLARNQITDVSVLRGLTSLTVLQLDGNHIADISPLSELTELTLLTLTDNSISAIEPLRKLTGLTRLYLDFNHISDINPLAELTELTTLSLSSNKISDIGAISRLLKLDMIDLSGNQISDISALRGLTNLEVLGLSYNQVRDISVLNEFSELTYLHLDDNPITDWSPVEHIEHVSGRP